MSETGPIPTPEITFEDTMAALDLVTATEQQLYADYIHPLDEIAKGYPAVVDAMARYKERASLRTVGPPNRETTLSPNLDLIASLIGGLAQKGTNKSTGVNAPGMQTPGLGSASTLFLATRAWITREPWSAELSDSMVGTYWPRERLEELLNFTVTATYGPKELNLMPSCDSSQVEAHANVCHELKTLVGDDALYARLPDLADLYRRFPTHLDEQYLVLGAYADILRAFSPGRGYTVPSYIGSEKQQELYEAGVYPNWVAAYETAALMSDLRMGQAIPVDDRTRRVHMQIIADTLGLPSGDREFLDRQDWTRALTIMSSMSEPARLITEAYANNIRLMKANTMLHFASEFAADDPLSQKTLGGRIHKVFDALSVPLGECCKVIQENLGPLANGLMLDDPRLAAIVQTETELTRPLAESLDRYLATGLITEEMHRALGGYTHTIIGDEIRAIKQAEQSAWLHEHQAEHEAKLAALDTQYHYTADRARAYPRSPHVNFAGGTRIAHELVTDSQSQLPAGDELRQTLAIIALDATQGSDQEAYLEKLHDDHLTAEGLIEDLRAHGIDRDTRLTHVMRWVRQALDGDNTNIKNPTLRAFMDAYLTYITEPEPQEPSASKAAAETTQPTSEARPPRKPDSKAALRKRLAHPDAVEVLDSLDLEYAEGVAVFADRPKRASSTSRKKAQTPDNETEPTPHSGVGIDPERLVGMSRLQEQFASRGLTARLILTDPPPDSDTPYIVLYVHPPPSEYVEITDENKDSFPGVCYFEHTECDRATYAFPVGGADNPIFSWKDPTPFTRKVAREELGATDFPHGKQGSPTFMRHYEERLFNFGKESLASMGYSY